MMICKTARQSVPGCAKLSRREQCFIGKRFASDSTLGVSLFKRPYFINISAAHVPTIYLANNDEMLFITSDFLSHYQNLSQYRGETKKKSALRNANSEQDSGFHLWCAVHAFGRCERQIGWADSSQLAAWTINANEFRCFDLLKTSGIKISKLFLVIIN